MEKLFSESPILLLLPPDDDEDDHGEDVEHHEEARADPDGEVVPLREAALVVRARVRPPCGNNKIFLTWKIFWFKQ